MYIKVKYIVNNIDRVKLSYKHIKNIDAYCQYG